MHGGATLGLLDKYFMNNGQKASLNLPLLYQILSEVQINIFVAISFQQFILFLASIKKFLLTIVIKNVEVNSYWQYDFTLIRNSSEKMFLMFFLARFRGFCQITPNS